MNKYKVIKTFILSLIEKARKAFDIRDFFVFGGLIIMGYGLYLLRPWLGFATPGAILLCIGLFVGKRK